jgi:hypothetical protein
MNDDYYLGRSCPTEPQIDPATGAKLCELPNTVTPTQKLVLKLSHKLLVFHVLERMTELQSSGR